MSSTKITEITLSRFKAVKKTESVEVPSVVDFRSEADLSKSDKRTLSCGVGSLSPGKI